MAAISGVYEIKNLVTGIRYVGSSKKVMTRLKEHRRELVAGCHHSAALQNAWNKYGAEKFKFALIEEIEEKNLISREQELLTQVFCEADTYNISREAKSPMKGRVHSEKTKALMSQQRSGKLNSFLVKRILKKLN
jgi:group I intron endonuclease